MPHKRSPTGHAKQKDRSCKYKTFEQAKKESDTIRGLVKDLNQRDLLTGEIIYRKENEQAVQEAVAAGTFTLEDWRGNKQQIPFDSEKVNKIMVFEYGEVLNRAIEPCWWR